MNKEIELMETISKLTNIPIEELELLYKAIEENNKIVNVVYEFMGQSLTKPSFSEAVYNKVKEKENK